MWVGRGSPFHQNLAPYVLSQYFVCLLCSSLMYSQPALCFLSPQHWWVAVSMVHGQTFSKWSFPSQRPFCIHDQVPASTGFSSLCKLTCLTGALPFSQGASCRATCRRSHWRTRCRCWTGRVHCCYSCSQDRGGQGRRHPSPSVARQGFLLLHSGGVPVKAGQGWAKSWLKKKETPKELRVSG